jgi:hypothetical protein
VDQIRAAPVLAGAGRALIAGDPRQLRFVCFVAQAEALEAPPLAEFPVHEIERLGPRVGTVHAHLRPQRAGNPVEATLALASTFPH